MVKSKQIKRLSELTALSKVQCYREFFSFTRSLKYLGLEKYAINLPDGKYHASLYEVDDGMDYSHLRLWIGERWSDYVTIYKHRGLVEPIDGKDFSYWGINNMQADIEEEFDTLDELKTYLEGNYEKYGLYLV